MSDSNLLYVVRITTAQSQPKKIMIYFYAHKRILLHRNTIHGIQCPSCGNIIFPKSTLRSWPPSIQISDFRPSCWTKYSSTLPKTSNRSDDFVYLLVLDTCAGLKRCERITSIFISIIGDVISLRNEAQKQDAIINFYYCRCRILPLECWLTDVGFHYVDISKSILADLAQIQISQLSIIRGSDLTGCGLQRKSWAVISIAFKVSEVLNK